MPTRSVSRSADLLIVGALLSSLSACGSDNAAPPGVAIDPSVVDGSRDAGDPGDEGDAASEQADSGSRSDGGGVDAGSSDAQMPSGDAGKDAAAPEDDIDAALARIDGSSGELGNLARVERLLVADGRNKRVYALDVAEAKLLDTFTFAARASVHSGPSGRFGYALLRDANQVQVLDMGLLADPKAESRELAGPVQLLTPAISATGPSGFTPIGKREVGLFFAGRAELAAFADDERSVQERAATFAAGEPHAGFVLSLNDHLLTTRSNAGSVQLVLLDAQLRAATTTPFNCEQPTSGVAAAGVAAVSCDQGVLRVAADGSSKLLAYPTDTPAGAEQLAAHPSEPIFAALIANELCSVRDALKCVDPPGGGVLALAFEPSGKRILVLTGDGVLHAYASDTLQKVGQLALTAPSAALPVGERPQLASGRNQVYVSDPLAHQVYVVDATKLKHTGSLMLPNDATPTQLAVFRYP